MVFSTISRAAMPALRTATRPSAINMARPAIASLGRRGYAEAVSDKLHLSLILPHDVR